MGLLLLVEEGEEEKPSTSVDDDDERRIVVARSKDGHWTACIFPELFFDLIIFEVVSIVASLQAVLSRGETKKGKIR